MIVCLIFPLIVAKFPPDGTTVGTTISFLKTKPLIPPMLDDIIYTTVSPYSSLYPKTKSKTKPVLPPWADSFTTASPVQTAPPFELDVYMEVFRIGSITNMRKTCRAKRFFRNFGSTIPKVKKNTIMEISSIRYKI